MKPTLEESLKHLQAPPPDPMARLRAKRAALAEFARAQSPNHPPAAKAAASQENSDSTRLSRESTSGRTTMKTLRHRGWYAMAAGLGVVALGLTWVLPNLERYTHEVTGLQQPAELASEPSEDARLATDAAEPTVAESAETEAPPPVEAEILVDRAEPAIGATRPARELARVAPETSVKTLPLEAAPSGVVQTVEATPPSAVAGAIAPPGAPALDETAEVVVTGSRVVTAPQKSLSPSTVVDSRSIRARVRQPHVKEEARDRFQHFDSNPLHRVAEQPVSTFSADVDTASYSFARAQLMSGVLPQKDAVRSEEMINYFDYAWPAAPSRNQPLKPTVVVSESPWNPGRKLVHIGIKGYELRDEAPDANLVLLLDVSGSMDAPNKLPLAVRSMELLLDSLKPTDTVGIVVYAGAAGTVLEPTPVREKSRILAALRSLEPGGSTAGAEGIERAYQLAEAHFRKGGVNRILLATDGDFNVGIDSTEELKGYVERKRAKGVYLSVLGFGQGNYRDELAQALAQNGNGVAVYIDTENEARKVLVREASSSLFTIAKDVKLQVEFNPATVSEYRLIGYETRALRREDFNNDAVDAGDVGAGHTVTAIYEITPVGAGESVDEPRYSGNRREPASSARGREEYGFLKIRYKLPGQLRSTLLSEPIPVRGREPAGSIARDVQFSTAVAGFAQLLRGGQHTGDWSYEDVLREASAARGEDPYGYRAEFIDLVRRAQAASER